MGCALSGAAGAGAVHTAPAHPLTSPCAEWFGLFCIMDRDRDRPVPVEEEADAYT